VAEFNNRQVGVLELNEEMVASLIGDKVEVGRVPPGGEEARGGGLDGEGLSEASLTINFSPGNINASLFNPFKLRRSCKLTP
jgi:hypothetical protein